MIELEKKLNLLVTGRINYRIVIFFVQNIKKKNS